MFRIRFLKTALALPALLLCAGMAHAASLVATPTALSLSCDTVLGATPVNLAVVLASGASAATVTPTVPGGSPVVVPSASVVNSTTVATNFTFSVAAGCKGATNNQLVVITLTPNTGTALTVNATLTVTNSGSALAPSPSAVTISCTKAGAVYTPGATQTVNVTSPAIGGTPFTVDNTTNVLPSWLQVTPLTGGTASSTAIALSVVAKSGCGGLSVGSTTFNVHLLNPPAADKLVPVTIQIGATSTVSSSVPAISLSYVKGSNSYTGVPTNISASPAVFFTVDPITLPVWLSASPATGTTTSPVAVTFTPTAGAETLSLGNYTANVHLKVSGQLDFVQTVKLQVQNAASTMTVSEGTTRNLNWTLGTALPSLVITPVSSDSPIPFTVTTSGSLSPQVSATQGLAYSFGSPIAVTFLQSVFGAAAPGNTLSGHVIITPNVGSAVDVTINVLVKSPGAAISSISPASLPTASSGTFTVALSGSGFIVNVSSSIATTVGVVNGGFIVPDANIVATIQDATSIVLQITASSSDPYLPFSGNGGTVTIGVCNPQGSTCSTPTSTTTLTIGINPIIRSVTSGSSFMQIAPPALTPVAPYDVLSIFGVNFCVSGGTGCLGPNAILYGTTDPVTLKYLNSLSPDAAGATQRSVAVTFQTHGSSPVAIATAPLLFVSNNQINLVVPDAVKTYIGNTVDVVVSFGYGTGATMLKSAPYSVTVSSTDPGVFTIAGDGQGDAAALSAGYALITQSAPAIARSTATDSDIIQLYVTGLGRPDSDDTGTGYSATCMLTDGYWAAVNSVTGVSPALTSNDGLVLQSTIIPSGQIQPCIKANSSIVPTVTVGGVNAPVKYAGWVSGSIAGLYQINLQLPGSGSSVTDESGTTGTIGATALHLPVVVTAAGKSSQASGADLWAMRGLQVVATGATTGTTSAAWAGSQITATEGTSTYSYAVTTGTLPAGLALDATTGAITGQATATGTSTVVFTATDSAGTPLTGSVSVTFTIN